MGISTICTTHKFLPKEPQVYFFQRTMRTTTIVLASALVVIGTIMHAEPTFACGPSYADYEYYEERYSRICCGIRCSVKTDKMENSISMRTFSVAAREHVTGLTDTVDVVSVSVSLKLAVAFATVGLGLGLVIDIKKFENFKL